MSERVTIIMSSDEFAALQERASHMTRAEKCACKPSDILRNALAYYCAEQDRCLSCKSGSACQIHGTKVLRPGTSAERTVSVDDMRLVTQAYKAAFVKARRVPAHFGGAENRAVRALIEKIGAEMAVSVINHAFNDPFYRVKATILTISADPSKHMGHASAVERRSSLQADSGYEGGKERR